MFWLFLGWHLLGVTVGAFVATVMEIRKRNKRSIGVLRLDRSDPDSPYLFLELDTDGMSKISKLDYVVLDVNLKNYISQ